MLSYRVLLKQAWDISWKHKYLWFLGLFASLVAGGGTWEYQLLTQNINQGLIAGSYYSLSRILDISDLIKNLIIGFVDLFHYDFWTILNALSLLIITAVLLIFFIWLAVACQAALVSDVKKIVSSKKKEPKLSIREGLTDGHRYFWTVLGLNIIMKVLVSLIFIIVSLPLLFMVIRDTTVLATVYTILFVIFIPISVGLSLMLKYAIAYKVLDNKSFVASLEHAGKLFGKNWLVSLEMAIIIFILSFLASGVVLMFLSLFLLPLFMIGLMFNLSWLIVSTIFLAIMIIVVFGSAITTFQTATWTNLFLHLKEKGGLAKLERIFSRQS